MMNRTSKLILITIAVLALGLAPAAAAPATFSAQTFPTATDSLAFQPATFQDTKFQAATAPVQTDPSLAFLATTFQTTSNPEATAARDLSVTTLDPLAVFSEAVDPIETKFPGGTASIKTVPVAAAYTTPITKSPVAAYSRSLPEVSPIPVAQPYRGQSCTGENTGQFFSSPNDCNKFFICDKGYVHSFSCLHGLCFDPRHSICAYCFNVEGCEATQPQLVPSIASQWWQSPETQRLQPAIQYPPKPAGPAEQYPQQPVAPVAYYPQQPAEPVEQYPQKPAGPVEHYQPQPEASVEQYLQPPPVLDYSASLSSQLPQQPAAQPSPVIQCSDISPCSEQSKLLPSQSLQLQQQQQQSFLGWETKQASD